MRIAFVNWLKSVSFFAMRQLYHFRQGIRVHPKAVAKVNPHCQYTDVGRPKSPRGPRIFGNEGLDIGIPIHRTTSHIYNRSIM